MKTILNGLTYPRLRTLSIFGLGVFGFFFIFSCAGNAQQFGDFFYSTTNSTIAINGYTGAGGAVTIPDTIAGMPVTIINDSAFSTCDSLTGVTIPNSVTSIGHSAFYSCASLTSVTIPNSVTSIGSFAFACCDSLTAITVDTLNPAYSSVDGVLFNKSQTALIEYPGGKSVNYSILNNVTSIEDYAFYRCASLTGVTIPNSITNIGSFAFYGCTSLTSITIPNGTIQIQNRAFSSCASLTNVTIPSSLSFLSSLAFESCTNLTAITVDVFNPAYSSVDGVLFNKSQTWLFQCPGGKTGDYTIPNSVTNIGDYAFCGCISLASVTIPNSVTNLGYRVFYGCARLTSLTVDMTVIGSGFSGMTNLTHISMGNHVKTIGNFAFDGAINLTSVTIPNSVTNIGGGAFHNCSSLAAMTVDSLNSAYSSADGVLFNKSQTMLIQCPSGKIGDYTIPDGVTNIGNGAFSSCASLASITIPNSVTKIGSQAFYDCARLTSLTVDMTAIGSEFSGMTNLTNMIIGSHVNTYNSSLFIYLTNLRAITVDALNTIYSSVDGVLFDKSQTTLIHCPGGKTGSYTIPNSVNIIGGGAFNYCSSLASVTSPNNVTNIGSSAFYNCSNLAGVYFKGDAPVGRSMFDGSSKATVYYLAGTKGWLPKYDNRPTVQWNPKALTSDVSFGVRTNRFGFNITGSSGMVILVEGCTNLANPAWFPVETSTIIGSSSYFSDPQWTNSPTRFYRLSMP